MRSRKRSKTKSRSKSKKLRHSKDAVSYSDDGHSTSSLSVSSSSSEDDHRTRRRSRSQARKIAKEGKKRPRKHSYSSDGSEDSPRVRKRKGSKRNDDYEGRKRTYRKKKKLRRDLSVSSTSSESQNCSTCHDGSSSSNESEFERKRGRSERKDRNKRKPGHTKIDNKASRNRSRSRSLSSSPRRTAGYQIEDKLTGENNSRRLRSVITVTREDNYEGSKEEIVYDQDDYPSCRSNDSNDGGSKRELAHEPHVSSEMKRHVEDKKGETSVSDCRTNVFAVSGEDVDSRFGALATNSPAMEKTNQASGASNNLNSDSLELILRQRALENLKRFRGGGNIAPMNQKDRSSNDMKPLFAPESVQDKSSKVDGARVGGATPVMGRINLLALRNDSQKSRKILVGRDGEKEIGSASPRETLTSGNTKDKTNINIGSFTNKPKLVSSVWRRELSNAPTTRKQAITPQEPSQAKLKSGSIVEKSAAGSAQTSTPESSNDKKEVNNTGDSASEQPLSSVAKPGSGDVRPDKPHDETKDGSQFEQKTMSVMRGGEMVQVRGFHLLWILK